ncbi:MAG: ABC transporter ATP-binding protein [Actinomycetota bacterium]|nr:ABC transporter ATP-binding protein [Actinomycetota bacterium]
MRAALGPLDLRAELDVAPGSVLAVLGPNGAGKTTLLRALAGLHPGPVGSVEVDGRVLDGERTRVPPEARDAGVVFQDYLLFPHLSALDNAAFGLRARGSSRAEARRVAGTWLERLGVGDVAAARPRALSGGQAQRVAIARALAADPRLVLLDEPLAALDASSRATVRHVLRGHLAGGRAATVVVSHDALDVLVLADRAMVLDRGAVVQTGTPAELARRPHTPYVARLMGRNLVRVDVRDGELLLPDGSRLAPSGAHSDGPALAAFAPSAVTLARARPGTTPAWRATVTSLESHADVVRVSLTGPADLSAHVPATTVADLDLRPGAVVWAGVAPDAVESYAVPAVG